jgi:hypothetical protein
MLAAAVVILICLVVGALFVGGIAIWFGYQQRNGNNIFR